MMMMMGVHFSISPQLKGCVWKDALREWKDGALVYCSLTLIESPFSKDNDIPTKMKDGHIYAPAFAWLPLQ